MVEHQLSRSPRLNSKELLAGRYLLQERVRFGGFCELWKAYDRVASEIVVVKVLHATWQSNPVRSNRFVRAALDMAELRHPAIAEILSAVQEGGAVVDPFGGGGEDAELRVLRGAAGTAASTLVYARRIAWPSTSRPETRESASASPATLRAAELSAPGG